MCSAAAAAALTTGTVLGVSAYRSGDHFHPSDTERGFNVNRVHFDDDQDVKGSDSTAEQDDSELWEQDSGADDTSDPQNDSSADFMFQRERIQEVVIQQPQNSSGERCTPGRKTSLPARSTMHWKPM